MVIVKVLVDAVGTYNAGDIVTDAPAGLVEIAQKETRNAATGELLAVIVEDDNQTDDNTVNGAGGSKEEDNRGELDELKAVAKKLHISGYTK
ncbi:hypothetical protein [Paenibacillus cellulosilyticus]|nr:hypothetical protein [Paenibacillus cellulosilyticus]